MAEKRFKLIEESDWWGVTDNQLPKTEYGFREDLPNGYLSCDYNYNDLTPQEVVDLLNTLHKENQQLKKTLRIIADAESVRDENSVKEILRNNLFGLDTVTGESFNAYKEYTLLNKFFKDYYNEYWDNDKYD